MQEMSHQMMGYDRASTMFSPDGRLLQVEYAKESVKIGSTSIGIVCKDGVVLVGDKRGVDRLMVPDAVDKVFQVDDHLGAVATGAVMDGRVLIERAQVLAQQHRITYGTPMDTASLVKEICDVKQFYTQYAGARPFGVSILFAGVEDDGPNLFVTDPTGIFFGYKAIGVGEGEVEVKSILNKEYRDNMSVEEGIKLAVSALKTALGKEFDIRRVEAAYIKTDDKKFVRVDRKQLRA